MNGWYARIYLKGKVYNSKYFSDSLWDGKQNGLREAKKWRDEQVTLRNEKYPEAKNWRRRVRHDKRNKTGIIGVSRTRQKSKDGTYSEFYQATWNSKPNQPQTRRFSIKKYGEAGALYEAWKVRRAAEIKIYGEANKPNYEQYQKLTKSTKGGMPDFSELFVD